MSSHSVILAEQDYPLLNLVLTMFWFFLWISWLFFLFHVLFDIFASHDLSGWAKAGWSLLVIILPILGTLTYVVVRGEKMMRRDARQMSRSQDPFRGYGRQSGGSATSAAEELVKLAALRDQGVLTESEFADQKAKILA